MCSGDATVVYGLIIKTWTLLAAAHAFPAIQPILLALDMILHRKRAGTLRMEATVENNTNFSDLPEEVLEIIRKKVFWTLNMREEAIELVVEELNCGVACPHCGKDRENGEHTEIAKDDWTTLEVSLDCGECSERVFENFIYSHDLDDQIRDSEILELYGLDIVPVPVYSDDDGSDLNEYHSAVSIAIPSNSITTEANHESFRSSSTVLKFNPSTFDTEAANRRLIQFVKDFGLKLYEGKVQEMGEGSKRIEEDTSIWTVESKETKGKKGNRKVQLQKIEPRWMVIDSIDSCQ